MKYIPVNAKDRSHIGTHWNRKYLRTVQAILNVTHGAVMPRRDFFEKAFGRNIYEFNKLLIMPEDYVYYRMYCEDKGLVRAWNNKLQSLKSSLNGDYEEAMKYIYKNKFRNLPEMFIDKDIMNFLNHYKNRVALSDYRNWKELRK